MNVSRILVCLLAFGLGLTAAQAGETYSFGVLPQRSAVLTAQYWNPILDHAGRQAGVTLSLKVARTAPESKEAVARGDYDFVYSNHFFEPQITSGYQVILRPLDEAISGQIVTLESSPIKSLGDLNGKEVGFPSAAAFVGYQVPMDHLLRQKIDVTPVFGGNQEGIMGQLKVGRVAAAGVNGQVMKAYAAREGVKYRVLWESGSYFNIPVAVHPRVPRAVAEAVRKAIDAMDQEPEGRKVLEASAQTVGQKPPYGFRASGPADYRNYTDFYKNTVLKDVQ
ncbi:phosphate/phosphite/phosphonate ABC transporter substrate-binding protein [bacterium]|nr:phosphate/phosphite/phosphonate ABC transporter substrate-binding protein [bacterium]